MGPSFGCFVREVSACMPLHSPIRSSAHTGISCRQTTSGLVRRDELDHLPQVGLAAGRERVAVEEVPGPDEHDALL